MNQATKRALAMCWVFGTLYGCASTQKPVEPEPILIAPKTTVVVPEAMLQDCATQLPPLTASKYTQGQSLGPITKWADTYTDCRLKFSRVRNLLAGALNIQVDNTAPASGKVVASPAVAASTPAAKK